jgi:hypothetical protein
MNTLPNALLSNIFAHSAVLTALLNEVGGPELEVTVPFYCASIAKSANKIAESAIAPAPLAWARGGIVEVAFPVAEERTRVEPAHADPAD